MTYHYLAFFMGLFGSIHCAVMCGPLLIAVQGGQAVSWKQTFNKLLYQCGRILTYGCIGLLLGLIGNLAVIQGGQQFLSITTGAVLIALGIFYLVGKKSSAVAQFQTKAIQPLVKVMGKWLVALRDGLYGTGICHECGWDSQQFFLYGTFWIGNITPHACFFIRRAYPKTLYER
jgi:sulfite exporter TauE/SafE